MAAADVCLIMQRRCLSDYLCATLSGTRAAQQALESRSGCSAGRRVPLRFFFGVAGYRSSPAVPRPAGALCWLAPTAGEFHRCTTLSHFSRGFSSWPRLVPHRPRISNARPLTRPASSRFSTVVRSTVGTSVPKRATAARASIARAGAGSSKTAPSSAVRMCPATAASF